jgi:hypothetical protein
MVGTSWLNVWAAVRTRNQSRGRSEEAEGPQREMQVGVGPVSAVSLEQHASTLHSNHSHTSLQCSPV